MGKVHGFVFQEKQESGDRKKLAFTSGIPRKKVEIFTENTLSISGYCCPHEMYEEATGLFYKLQL